MSFKPDWIKTGITRPCVDFAEKIGEELCDLHQGRTGRNALTTSQIRNVFGEVRRIQNRVMSGNFDEEKAAFLLLRPKLAYAEARAMARNKQSKIQVFKKVVELAHNEVDVEDTNNRRQQFQNFVDFMEAILAYHKAYGGRD